VEVLEGLHLFERNEKRLCKLMQVMHWYRQMQSQGSILRILLFMMVLDYNNGLFPITYDVVEFENNYI
jgi:hypothetical protein